MWLVREDDYDWCKFLGVFDYEEDAQAVAEQIPGTYHDEVKYYKPGDHSLRRTYVYRVYASIHRNGTVTINEPEQLESALVDDDGVVEAGRHKMSGKIYYDHDDIPVSLEIVMEDSDDAYRAVVTKLNELVPFVVRRYQESLTDAQRELHATLRTATPL